MKNLLNNLHTSLMILTAWVCAFAFNKKIVLARIPTVGVMRSQGTGGGCGGGCGC